MVNLVETKINYKVHKVKLVSGFLLLYTIHIKDGLTQYRAKAALVIYQTQNVYLIIKKKTS